VERWAIPLFSEEMIRGGPVFALSRLLHPLSRALRESAGLSGWQVVSPAHACGRIEVIEDLHAVQSKRYSEATVIVTDIVSGDEEIPEGVRAVLTTSQVDLVSHLAVRARNAGVLLAICFEAAELETFKKRAGWSVMLRVTPSGEVQHEEAAAPPDAPPSEPPSPSAPAPRTPLATIADWAIADSRFSPDIVGGKSNNLNGLRNRIPSWIHLPRSVALPFGTLERALDTEDNRAVRDRIEELLRGADANVPEVLSQVRSLASDLAAPRELKGSLLQVWEHASLPPVSWEQTWRGITRVWASKWNERAYLSRRARGVPDAELKMAVLIQQVVEADYAFVIHTANPMTGNRDELFAEVVLGLGETLVGNDPGRALGFVARKTDLRPRLISYPSKSVGLYGRGVIFRSDSNGEDLAEFAGAGLYDSFLADDPEPRPLDYTNERLIWDQEFSRELLQKISQVGIEVERTLGSPQDIEGAIAGDQLYVVQTRPQVGLDK
jgi:alpha-glucan,water dikinase